MERPAPARPAAVNVIGIFSIVLATIFLFLSLTGLAGAALVRMLPALPSGTMPPEVMRMVLAASRAALPRAVLQLIVGGVMLVTSIQLLRLREAGRRGLEALNWFGILYVIGSAVYGVLTFPSVARAAEFGAEAHALPLAFAAFGAAMWAAVQLVVIAIIIWQLRTPAVRSAMQ